MWCACPSRTGGRRDAAATREAAAGRAAAGPLQHDAAWAKERLESHGGRPIALLDAEEQRRLLGGLGAVGSDYEAAVRAYGLQSAESEVRDYSGPHRQLLLDYDAAKRAAGSMDFEDLLKELSLRLARGGDGQPPPRHLLVDEFQDLNPVQIRILRRLREAGSCVFCVGDQNQAIYGFRGATPDCMAASKAWVARRRSGCAGTPQPARGGGALAATGVAWRAAVGNPAPSCLFGASEDESRWLRSRGGGDGFARTRS